MHHPRDALLLSSPNMLASTDPDQQDVRECLAGGRYDDLGSAAFYKHLHRY
jgi:hypothetical protein